jgi:hypothetical protein
MSRFRGSVLFLGVAAQFLAIAPARADVPTDYKGTPYMGTPSAIPGRVELANLDVGGEGVSYHADHNRMNSAGYEPISGNDYRPTEKDLPNICKTNEMSMDFWVDGKPYPSDTVRAWYYMGYAHAHDWVKLTVNVAQAGTYNVSSNWASAGAEAGLSLWFNDGHSTADPTHPGDGENKSGIITLQGTSDYHKWKAYPNFAKVTLTAGVQVMTFHLEKDDHLQYGFLQFDLEGGNPIGTGGAGSGGAGGAGGAAANAGSGGVANGSGGGSGDSSVSPTGGAAGSAAVPAAGSAGTASSTGGASAAAGGTSSAPPTTSAPSDSSSCTYAPARHGSRSPASIALLLLSGLAFVRRRGVAR